MLQLEICCGAYCLSTTLARAVSSMYSVNSTGGCHAAWIPKQRAPHQKRLKPHIPMNVKAVNGVYACIHVHF